jgi:hypothetical protein
VLHAKFTTEAHQATDQHLELTKLYFMENVRARGGAGINGSAMPPAFLEGVNLSLKISLPWMFSTRPAERGQGTRDTNPQFNGTLALSDKFSGVAAR